MFKSLFSFKGRIPRSEFWGSYFFIFILEFLNVALLAPFIGEIFGYQIRFSINLIILILFAWVLIALGAKRCHDRGNSGWFQFIPFYGFWMLFAKGESGSNEYGADPKSDVDSEESETENKNENFHSQPMMECPPFPGRVVCSDAECPCDNTTMPPAKGYLYISQELAEFRLKCLSMRELEDAISQALPGQIVTGAVGLPIVLCERGARLRKLDLEVAAQDYDTWVKTSKAPCRATPKEK